MSAIAHVISCGPSIRGIRIPDDGWRIAINRAPLHHATYDWLVFGDEIVAHELSACALPRPLAGICCPERYITMAKPAVGGMAIAWEWLWMLDDLGYSANVAIWFAATLGCQEIHLWGFDHTGTEHADGAPVDPHPCYASRWDRERPFFERTCALVRERGRTLIRH